MGKIQFDPNEPGGLELARQVVFERLRCDSAWEHVPHDSNDQSFDGYVDYIGDYKIARTKLLNLIREVI